MNASSELASYFPINPMPPAARLNDMHECPEVTGVIPHDGGPIIGPGCPTVQIGGMPASVVGDEAECAVGADIVTQGSATVCIMGKPAARMGDPTEHGGEIVAGEPTVNIGD